MGICGVTILTLGSEVVDAEWLACSAEDTPDVQLKCITCCAKRHFEVERMVDDMDG